MDLRCLNEITERKLRTEKKNEKDEKQETLAENLPCSLRDVNVFICSRLFKSSFSDHGKYKTINPTAYCYCVTQNL